VRGEGSFHPPLPLGMENETQNELNNMTILISFMKARFDANREDYLVRAPARGIMLIGNWGTDALLKG
jgi:hypothetical protein